MNPCSNKSLITLAESGSTCLRCFRLAASCRRTTGTIGPVVSAFYLTRTTHVGNQVLTACAAGYHMASLWEILDPSNLKSQHGIGFDPR